MYPEINNDSSIKIGCEEGANKDASGEREGQMPNSKDSMETELLEGAGVLSELGPSSSGIQRKMDLDHCFWSKKGLISMNGLREEHHLWTI